MTQGLPSLHPHPGWSDAPAPPPSATVGKHCILELYGCDQARLDDEAFLRDTITSAARRAGATLLNLITHRFEPQGVTGLALLAESHISIHTWPESGYAAVDVFTCGDHTMPERACAVLADELAAAHHKLTSFRRETPTAIAGVERQPSHEAPPSPPAAAALVA
ncbi:MULTISPECIES: adenosylmethionine decarboxylase [Aphanothece]|uniref:adenosylmethionine decarboxylase n=1 Tax=Aphanothece TaxID=1121 RepID=UPI00398F0301